jgi:H+-translocating NAD(P) transhydrogenase subunit alpha
VRIAVARETRAGETRVAIVPELVGRLVALGYDVAVEPGAGVGALHPDEEYAAAGAQVSGDALEDATLVISVNPLDRPLPAGTTTISLVASEGRPGITSFAMELVPRISRAQSMDMLRRFFPLHMTAAGMVPAAEVVVLGAGVAGLEAIATAKRLGAAVKAYDVRVSSSEEIRSVGAYAIDLGLEPLEGAAGYAREMTQERSRRQQEALAPYVAGADALITAASVAGRRAPLLVTAAMVEQMRPGSVVVDLAAESGGNVEGVVAGQVVRIGSARVWGGLNVPAQLPGPASRLYAQNVVSFVTLLTQNPDDEVVVGARVR